MALLLDRVKSYMNLMHFATSWPFWLVATLGLVFLAIVYLFYLKETKGLKKKYRICLLALRSLAILLLLFILLQVVILKDLLPQRPTLSLLFDDSLSMSLKDDYGEGDLSLFSSLKGPKGIPRIKIANLLLSSEWMKALSEDYDLRSYRFSATLQPSSLTEKIEVNQEGFATDIHQALVDVLDDIDDLSGVVLVTDGCWNQGSNPLAAARLYGGESIPIYTFGVGAKELAPDIILSKVEHKDKIFLGDVAVIEFTLRSLGFVGKEVPIRLIQDSKKIVEKKIILRGGLKSQEGKFVFLPEKPGVFNLSICISLQEGERTKENNTKNFTLKVIEEKMQVFLVEEEARWEYRFLKNVLERDPNVELKCLLYQGNKMAKGDIFLSSFPTGSQLNKYVLIILGNVDSSKFTAEQLKNIVLLVEQKGTALIIIAGEMNCPYSYTHTPLEKIIPVVLKKEGASGYCSKKLPFIPRLTLAGKEHLMLRLIPDKRENTKLWRNFPGGYWCAEVLKAKKGATVLAEHPYLTNVHGKLPLIIVQRYGSGKVLFMGIDNTWRWRLGLGDKYHYQFWGQVIRWLVRSRLRGESPYVKMALDKDKYQLGEKVYIEAYIMDRDFFPLKETDAFAIIKNDKNPEDESRIRLRAHTSEIGLHKAEFLPLASGRYKVQVLVPSLGDLVSGTSLQFEVESSSRELESLSLDYQLLEKMAKISGGKSYTVREIDKLASDINLAIKEKRLPSEYPLWDSLPVLLIFLVLLTTEWILRKKWGLA